MEIKLARFSGILSVTAVALFLTDQSEILLLTRLHVCDRSRVVKRATEKAPPTGGPGGIPHGSRMTGVSPQASAALHSIPDLPHVGNPHQFKQEQSHLNSLFEYVSQNDWQATRFFMFLIQSETKENFIFDTETNAPHFVWLKGKEIVFFFLEEECSLSSSLESPSGVQ